jgi:TrpR family transcriptional regulator, trp operon repressor
MSNFKSVISTIGSIQDRSLLEDFLMGITTPKERSELAKRLDVIERLLNGQPHHKIAKDLGVGVSTVTRGSKELSAGRFKVLRKQS